MASYFGRSTAIWLSLAFCLLAAVLFWLSLGPAPPTQRSSEDSATALAPTATQVHSAQPPHSPEQASTPKPLWRVVDEDSIASKPPLGEGWSAQGRLLVDITNATAVAHGLRAGDRMVVEVPQLDIRFDALVDQVRDGPGRARAVRGLAQDADGQPRRIVVTVGPGRVFAYVDTPQGPYELVGDGKLAWLMPSSSMMAGIDFTQPDYIHRDTEGRVPKAGVPGRGG